MGQKVLINVEPEDIRVAVLEEGVLTDLFIENRHEKTIVGNIYKGVVTDVIPGIQAAFVDIGLDRNAFLHVQDIPPQDGDEPVKQRGRRRGANGGGEGRRMNISDYLKPGQKVLVQAIKDGISEKGPRISQFISLPGRYLVLLPNQADDDSGGVSRKIEDARERTRLRRLLDSIEVDGGGSVILRTAAVDAGDEAILADAQFLQKTWERIQQRGQTAKPPVLLHTDYDILYRLVRDVFTETIDEICIDDTAEHANLVKMLRQSLPSLKNKVLLYPSTRNVFEVFDIERQIYKALRKRVWLRSGGHVIIDECEALTAIDVNTGKYIGKEDQDATVLRTNLEAARVISRQLRLRDIGGIIIIDFIDMRKRDHREEVLRELRRCLRLDRARTTISDFTSLGIVEMTRKRVRHSLRKTLQVDCPHCGGGGMILSPDSIWRVVRNATLSLIEDHPSHDITLRLHPEMLRHIEERHMAALREIENEHGITLTLTESTDPHQERYTLEASPQGEPAGENKIIVTGKRFSGAELDEPPQQKPSRRRRTHSRRAELEEPETVEELLGTEPEEEDDEDDIEADLGEVRSPAISPPNGESEARAPRSAPPAQTAPRLGPVDGAADILAMESLSGRLAREPRDPSGEGDRDRGRGRGRGRDRDREREPRPAPVPRPVDETEGENPAWRPEGAPDEDQPRRRRRRRGGRGRRGRRREGDRIAEGGAPGAESPGEAPLGAAALTEETESGDSAPDEFVSVDEYLGDEEPEAGLEPVSEAPDEEDVAAPESTSGEPDAAKRPRRKTAARKRSPAAAKKKPAAKRAAPRKKKVEDTPSEE